MHLKYQNIAISGSVASGKGTLKENLRPFLSPLGWKFASGGELVRKESGDNVSPSADQVSDTFHSYVEQRTEEMLTKHKHYVIEAWLAGWVARNMTDTLRVLLVCSNPAVVIDRMVNRDHVTVAEAKRILSERSMANEHTWRRLYGEYNFQDPSYFQLVIDTYAHNPKEVVAQVLETLEYEVN